MPNFNEKKLKEFDELGVKEGFWTVIGEYDEELMKQFISQALDEQREEIVKPHLDYCKKQNGLPYCKNCGLGKINNL